MKKLMLAAAALALAVVGFGRLDTSTTFAAPTNVYVINAKVLSALVGTCPTATSTSSNTGTVTGAHTCDPRNQSDRGFFASQLSTIQAASGLQTSQAPAVAGTTWILVQTNGSRTPITLNGQGLVCTTAAAVSFAAGPPIVPAQDATVACDGIVTFTPPAAPTAWDNFAVFQVTNPGSLSIGATVTSSALQDGTTLAGKTVTVVGQANNVTLSMLNNQTTVQAGATSCSITAPASSPNNATALVVYTDINGNALVGYTPTFASSSSSTLAVGSSGTFPQTSNASITVLQADGKTGAENAVCGNTAGSATLSATTVAAELVGVTGTVSRTQAIKVTGVPASIALTASPAAIPCDGTATSTVTAKVSDSAGNPAVDGTSVNFSVVALGTANPINKTTTGGSASSTITPLSGSTAGVTIVVTAGSVQSSIRVDCLPSLATPTGAAGAAPTAPSGITGPSTGNGGYLGQSGSAGFPLWTLVALALGSVVLVAGGLVTRRVSGK